MQTKVSESLLVNINMRTFSLGPGMGREGRGLSFVGGERKPQCGDLWESLLKNPSQHNTDHPSVNRYLSRGPGRNKTLIKSPFGEFFNFTSFFPRWQEIRT